MRIDSESNLHCISYAILKALLPSLCRDDICETRFARPGALGRPGFDSSDLPPSFIVRLATPELVQLVINAKKAFNYLTTRDIDTTLLSSEVACALPDTKIFVNEVLSTTDHLDFLSLKQTAKRMGFKYVWHRSGRFLVRWKEGDRAHAIRTHSDLSAILSFIKSNDGTLGTLHQPAHTSSRSNDNNENRTETNSP